MIGSWALLFGGHFDGKWKKPPTDGELTLAWLGGARPLNESIEAANYKRFLCVQPNSGISSRSEDPWLSCVENKVQHTQLVTDFVSAQNFERNDQRVRQQVAVYCAVEDLGGTIVGAASKERIALVVTDGANAILVIAHDLVWLDGQVKVKPANLLVITADDEIVATGMHIHGADPLDARLECF